MGARSSPKEVSGVRSLTSPYPPMYGTGGPALSARGTIARVTSGGDGEEGQLYLKFMRVFGSVGGYLLWREGVFVAR